MALNTEMPGRHLRNLYSLLGSQRTGPLLVQPLSRQQRTLGVLLVGNDRSQRAFSPDEQELCQRIGAQLGTAIENARLHSDLLAQVTRLSESLRMQQGESLRTTAVLESMPEGVIISGKDGRIVAANATAARTLGIPRERILGHSIERLLGEVALDTQAIAGVFSQPNRPVQATFESEHGIIHVSAAPVCTPKGDHAGVVAFLRDITQETEAEKARSEFITAISQGLRSPLTAVRGYAEALSNGLAGTVSDTQSHFLKIIRDNALRMVSLIENLIAASQIEKGFLTLQYGKTNLSLLISDVVRPFQGELEARQLELRLDVDDEQPLIEADPARVRQILENLVSNAIKFTYPGGRITIGARPLRDVEGQPPTYYSLWVADTGIGIAAEEQPKIWRRYYRPANSLATETGKLCVGLSIVKSLVEAHNGRVWVESTPGVGSTFTVLLPTRRIQSISGEQSQVHTSLDAG